VNYSRATPRETRERPVREVLDLSGAHQTVSGAPLAAPMLVFAPNFIEFSNLFSLLDYVELYALEINDN
jgi:hypothetical protein